MYEQDFLHIPLSLKDITFISHSPSHTQSHRSYSSSHQDQSLKSLTDLQHIHLKIQHLTSLNHQLTTQIQYIKQNPDSVGYNALGEELIEKIELLKRENGQLRGLMKRNKEETPMKRESGRESFKDSMRQSLNTPRKHNKQHSKHTIEKSNNNQQQRMRMSSNSILDEIDNNFYLEKAEVSTCQNYQMTYSKRGEEKQEKQENQEMERMKPLTEKEKKIKNGLRVKMEGEAGKESLVGNRLKCYVNEGENGKEREKEEREVMSKEQIERMAQYKQKLIKKLKSATLKQDQLKKILSQLDKLYTSSIQRYKQLQQLLQQHLLNRQNLSTSQTDIISRYHQALKLQQILSSLNHQYTTLKKSSQQSNQQQLSRLKSIKRELMSLINRLKLKLNIQGLGIVESIEIMAMEILNNVYIPNSRSMGNIQGKVGRIRELCEQEKELNAKIIGELKGKEQVLGKELLERQMARGRK